MANIIKKIKNIVLTYANELTSLFYFDNINSSRGYSQNKILILI